MDTSDARIMRVDVEFEPDLSVSVPEVMFEGRYADPPNGGYDVTAHGQRFVVVENSEPEKKEVKKIHIVQNWFGELKRLAPTE